MIRECLDFLPDILPQGPTVNILTDCMSVPHCIGQCSYE